VAPLDFIYVSRSGYLRFYDKEQVTEWFQYLVCLYVAFLGIGGNEMGPRTDGEILYIILVMVYLVLYNAFIFGQMSVLVSEVSKKESEF